MSGVLADEKGKGRRGRCSRQGYRHGQRHTDVKEHDSGTWSTGGVGCSGGQQEGGWAQLRHPYIVGPGNKIEPEGC